MFSSDLTGAGSLTPLQTVPVPSYGSALERRLSERTWLAVNVLGSFQSYDVPLSLSSDAVGGRTQVMLYTGTVTMLLGLRHVFARGLVDVSLYSAAFGSYQASGGDRLRTGEVATSGPQRGKNRAVGLVGGLAVERELVDALALRLSLDMLTAAISSADTVHLDSFGVEQDSELVTRRVGLSLRPGLQLYFYF